MGVVRPVVLIFFGKSVTRAGISGLWGVGRKFLPACGPAGAGHNFHNHIKMYSIHLTPVVRHAGRALAALFLITAASAGGDEPFTKFLIFGDSLSDTGNAFLYTGGFYPATPPNTPGRISNGKIWVEHLADSLGMEPQDVDNRAVAGARSDYDNFMVNFGLPLAGTGLLSQVEEYLLEVGPGGADPDALYTVWIGANDIFTTLTIGGDMNLTVYNAIQNTAQAVGALASNGARHIVVANLPDLGLTPFGLALGAGFSAQLSGLTDACNAGLGQALDSLDGYGIHTVRFDSSGLIREIAADPAAFGLVNATDQAVDSVDDESGYLFWDGVHPTTVGHKIIADRVVEELVAFYSPRKGKGKGPGLVNSLNGRVAASLR